MKTSAWILSSSCNEGPEPPLLTRARGRRTHRLQETRAQQRIGTGTGKSGPHGEGSRQTRNHPTAAISYWCQQATRLEPVEPGSKRLSISLGSVSTACSNPCALAVTSDGSKVYVSGYGG
jgi:hypothetical protein